MHTKHISKQIDTKILTILHSNIVYLDLNDNFDFRLVICYKKSNPMFIVCMGKSTSRKRVYI